MNIIARAALYLYDGSQAAPIFPDKVGKPGDEAAAYLSTVADKLMASDGSRTTCVEPNSAQEEMLRRFILTPFQEAADALMRSMDETMQALEIPREGFDMAIFSFEKDGNPHLCVAQSGYIKSRFLDDKLSVGILLGYAKYLKDEQITPERAVYVHITSFEEVGHGGSASVPAGVTEAISVDMGCVGEGLTCDERMVSICAKDSGGPYHYDVVRGLIAAAEKMGAPYAVDVYPRYGSDVEATLRAGYDIRHGLIGSGVYASHGYERSHVEGALATLKTLIGYVG